MAKKNPKVITIDPEKECTIKTYAEELKIPTQNISNWVKRGKIKFRTIPELNDLTLVVRGSESLDS